ncbi:MAG: molybdopterin molybdotransferase MoeA [Anaerolineae bacterium]
MSQTVSFEGALSCIGTELVPCEKEVIDLAAALDRVLAHDVAFDASRLPAGHRLGAGDISRLAESGQTSVAVVRRPRVGVLATGDELVPPGTPLRPGQIPNSSTPLVSACVRCWGGRPLDLGVAADRVDSLLECLERGRELPVDLLVTVGGTGRGDRDFLRPLLEAEGSMIFDGVAIRGGHTTIFGQYHGCPVLALPGTPGVCRITLEQFVRPAVLRLGIRPTTPVTVPARVVNGFRTRPILSFEWAQVTRNGAGFDALRMRGAGIGIWTSMVAANALLVVPAEITEVKAGDVLKAQLLDVSPVG